MVNFSGSAGTLNLIDRAALNGGEYVHSSSVCTQCRAAFTRIRVTIGLGLLIYLKCDKISFGNNKKLCLTGLQT